MTITDELINHVAGAPFERQQRFARARDVYEGDMDAPLVDDTGAPNALDNVIIPAARNIVDAGVSFLFGEDITFDVTEAYGEEAQKRLLQLWRRNRMPTRLLELAMHGGITGSFVFKFEPDPSNVRDGAHQWVIVDPCYLDVVWSPHDVTDILLYRFEYPTVAPDENGKLVPFVWRQDIEAVKSEPDQWGRRETTEWSITNYQAKAPTDLGSGRRWLAMRSISKWERVGEVHRWEHAWAPVFAGSNLVSPNDWWGYSDIEVAVVRLIDSLNRAISNTAKTVRHFAHPQPIVRGGTLPEDRAIGEPIEFEAGPGDVDVYNLEMQSDLAAALELLRELRSEVYDAGNTPEVARGKLDNAGALSGTALRILYGPLLSTTAKKRRTYGDELEAALRCALDYMQFQPLDGGDGDVHINWPDPLPRNEKEDAEVAEIDSRLGFSDETLIERRGGDPDVERERRLEQGANDPGMRGMLDLIPSTPSTPAPPTAGLDPEPTPGAVAAE